MPSGREADPSWQPRRRSFLPPRSSLPNQTRKLPKHSGCRSAARSFEAIWGMIGGLATISFGEPDARARLFILAACPCGVCFQRTQRSPRQAGRWSCRAVAIGPLAPGERDRVRAGNLHAAEPPEAGAARDEPARTPALVSSNLACLPFEQIPNPLPCRPANAAELCSLLPAPTAPDPPRITVLPETDSNAITVARFGAGPARQVVYMAIEAHVNIVTLNEAMFMCPDGSRRFTGVAWQ